jgi:hypothetical protein
MIVTGEDSSPRTGDPPRVSRDILVDFGLSALIESGFIKITATPATIMATTIPIIMNLIFGFPEDFVFLLLPIPVDLLLMLKEFLQKRP